MTGRDDIGRGTLWSVADAMTGQFLALAIFLITSRFVSQDAFGIMAVCFLMIDGFRQVFIESIGIALTAKSAPAEKDYNAGFLSISLGSIAAALAVAGMAYPLESFLRMDGLAQALQLVSVVIVTLGLSRMHEAWLSRHFKFKMLALRSIFSTCLGGAVGITMAVNGHGIASLIAQQITTALASVLMLWIAVPWKPGLRTDRATVMGLLRYAFHVGSTALANVVNNQSDVLFSSYYLGAAQTGIYNAAKRIMNAGTTILSASLNRVALPALASLSLLEEKRASFLTALSMTSLLTAPIFAGLAALAPELVDVLFSDDWHNVGPVLAILAVNGYISTIGQYNQAIVLVFGKPHWQTIITAIYGVSNVILFFIFARYGLTALALSFSIRAVLLYPLSAGTAVFLLKIRTMDYIRVLFPSVLSALIMAGLLVLLKAVIATPHEVLDLLLYVPCGAVIYTACMLVFSRQSVINFIAFARKIIT